MTSTAATPACFFRPRWVRGLDTGALGAAGAGLTVSLRPADLSAAILGSPSWVNRGNWARRCAAVSGISMGAVTGWAPGTPRRRASARLGRGASRRLNRSSCTGCVGPAWRMGIGCCIPACCCACCIAYRSRAFALCCAIASVCCAMSAACWACATSNSRWRRMRSWMACN